MPTRYAIRTHGHVSGASYLKLWLVETSADGESWRAVAREENNKQFKGMLLSGTFAVAGGGEYRFIRFVNIGKNHYGTNSLCISSWEIFGKLIE